MSKPQFVNETAGIKIERIAVQQKSMFALFLSMDKKNRGVIFSHINIKE